MIHGIKMKIIATRIEYHWLFIMHYRKKGNALISAGTPLSSEKLVRLSVAITEHSMKASALERQYERFCI